MVSRVLVIALLVAPEAIGYLSIAPAGRPAVAGRMPRLAACVRVRVCPPMLAAAASDDAAAAYRLLGLSDDASYESIWEAFEGLSETYAADPAYCTRLEEAKDAVLDDRLRQRMAGTLGATYEGRIAAEDRPVPPKTPLWQIANDFRKKTILVPSKKYAFQVFMILGGLTFATWLAPSTAGSILLINIASGMGFIYNRGEADVVRDDFGQIGEIRPMKPKPFALTVGMTALIGFAGWFRTKQIMATMVQAPRGLEGVIRTTLISLGLMVPSLFVRVHGLFD